jgi:hypothetical protein
MPAPQAYRFSDLVGAFDEKLRHRAERAVFSA